MPEYRRDAWRLALTLALILAFAWAPFLFFGKTLLASAGEMPSIYTSGAAPLRYSGSRVNHSLDPGAPAWQNEPWLALQHRLVFDEHVLPMWNPYEAYGAPFAASMIAQPFYPLTFAVAIHPTPWTYNLLVIGRIFLLALGCALFVRLFTGFTPAFVAGICAAFSGYFLIFDDIVHVGVEVMLPWILLGFELVIRRAGPRSSAVLAAAWAVSLLGGMPESTALAAIVCGLYASFRLLLERGDNGTVKRLLWVGSGIGVGTALGGIMIFPFLEYLGRDIDVHQTHPPGLIFDAFEPRKLLTEFAPLALGPPLNFILSAFNGFTGFRGAPGTFAIFLSAIAGTTAIGAFARRTLSDRVALFFIVAALGFELKRFGFPLINWIGALPALRLVLFTKYGEADVAVCIACAAGFGVAAVLDGRVKFWQLFSAAAIVLGFVTWLFDATVLPPETKHSAFLYLAVGLALSMLGLSALLVAYATRQKQSQRVGLACIGLALFESLFAYFVPLYYVLNKPAPASLNPYAAAPFVGFLQHATRQDGGRIVATGGTLFPDWSDAFGIYDTRALSAMYPGRYLHFINAFLTPQSPTLAIQSDRFSGTDPIDFKDPLVQRWMTLSSIDYVVTTTPLAPHSTAPHMGLEATTGDPNVSVYRVNASLPRLTLFHNVQPAAGGDEALQRIAGTSFDPKRSIVIEGELPTVESAAKGDRVALVERSSQRVEADVTTASNAVLLQNDTWYPGWRATVDGRDTPILRADYLFRAIAIPAGTHRVIIEYRSRAVAIGLGLTVFGLLSFALMLAPTTAFRQTIAGVYARRRAKA